MLPFKETNKWAFWWWTLKPCRHYIEQVLFSLGFVGPNRTQPEWSQLLNNLSILTNRQKFCQPVLLIKCQRLMKRLSQVVKSIRHGLKHPSKENTQFETAYQSPTNVWQRNSLFEHFQFFAPNLCCLSDRLVWYMFCLC